MMRLICRNDCVITRIVITLSSERSKKIELSYESVLGKVEIQVMHLLLSSFQVCATFSCLQLPNTARYGQLSSKTLTHLAPFSDPSPQD